MNTKHTPGPWRWQLYELDAHYGYVIDETEWKPVCNIVWRNGEANARLIAAAPDMLAVLESALAAWPQLDTDEEINGADLVEWFCTHFAPSARAAIAKTEGGAS